MHLEDKSSRGLSSVDFGRAAELPKRRSLKGLAAPPPTECIQMPSALLETEAAVLEAIAEKQTLEWRLEVALHATKQWASRTWDAFAAFSVRTAHSMMESAEEGWAYCEPRIQRLSVQLQDRLQDFVDRMQDSGTATTRPPVLEPKPRRRSSQWDVTTVVVDMSARRRPSSLNREVKISDLTL